MWWIEINLSKNISGDNALIVIVAILVINNTYHNDYKRNRIGYPHHNRI